MSKEIIGEDGSPDTVTMQFKVTNPELVQAMFQEIQGVGAVMDWDEGGLTIEIEAPSEFDIGVTVAELRQTLTGMAMENIEIS